MRTRIMGTGCCPGDHLVSNGDLAEIVETSDEWIYSRTGIKTRYISTESGTSKMAAKAARMACTDAGVRPEELDLILVATSTPEHCFPSSACKVQAELGAENAAAYDISAACSGFIFALYTANSFLASGMFRKILVIGADDLSKITDWSDRKTCVLFGDGAGACIVAAEEGEGCFKGTIKADGRKGSVLSCISRTEGNFLTGKKPLPGFMEMDGQEVFKFAVKKVPESILDLLGESKVSKEEIRYYFLHQANVRIIESVAKRLKEPMEKFPTNMESYGNTSAATIPILLDEWNRKGCLNRGDKIILSGFGGGLTWGSILMEW